MPGMSPRIKIKKGRPLDNWVPGDTPVVTITAFTASPDIKDNPDEGFTATAVDTEQGDMAQSIKWLIVSAFAIPATFGVANADLGTVSLPGSTVTSLGAGTYDFDVDVDGGGNSQESITTSGGETLTAIAALISAQVTGGAVAYTNPESPGTNAFKFTSAGGPGIASTMVVAPGTAGSGGGDLFAALDAADGSTTTFPAPVDGADIVPEETVVGGTGPAPSLNFLVLGVQDVVAQVTDGGVVGDDTQSVTVVDA